MLHRLTVTNLALIESLTLEFNDGLTVISGETGAGKSIIIQAMAALLGDPVHTETVKTGATIARVEGDFSVSSDLMASTRFKSLELDAAPETHLLLTREIHREGRSRFLVNDQVVKKADFQWLGQQLLDVNSQHSHQFLLKSRFHMELLDSALQDNSKLRVVKETWDRWHAAAASYRTVKKLVEEMEKRRQLIEYQMQEIDDANLRPDEKQELVVERERLRFAEEIRHHLGEAVNLLDDLPVAVADNSARVASLIARAAHRDPRLLDLAGQAESLALMARDLSEESHHAMGQIDISPDKLNSIGERLYEIQQLEGKFRNDVEGILNYRQVIDEEYREYNSRRNDLEAAEQECVRRMSEYMAADSELSLFRQIAAPAVCRRIEASLADLGMPHAQFDVALSAWQVKDSLAVGEIPERCTERGTDQVEFLISANPGVPLKSLSQVASGGELSRVMMALKQHLV